MFALVAIERDYTIDFIEGDMLERSPFTLMDFIKQRQRWMQGLFMVAFVSPMKIKTKLFLMMSVSSWLVSPLYTFGVILQNVVLAHPPGFINVLQQWIGAYYVYLHIVGCLRQFEFTFHNLLLLLPNILIGCITNAICENIATICALRNLLYGDWYGFHLIQKEIDSDHNGIPKTTMLLANGTNGKISKHQKDK